MTAKCNECKIRTIGTGKGQTYNDRADARQHEMCVPCLERSYWENAHSDHAHDDIAKTPEGQYPSAWSKPAKSKIAENLVYVAEERKQMAVCWICRPELDLSKETAVERTGTTRMGMTMVVALRASAEEKSETIREALASIGLRGSVVNDGDATLKMAKGAKAAKISVEANWDFAGRWVSGSVNGKKVRNAKELLRVVAAITAK